MATDNVTLNSGAGGATMRALADASNNEWPASVTCYATTLSPGANVLQVVTASAGLPVAQQGTWNVGITGTPGVTVSGSVAVTGTFWQATQPVSGTVTANAGTNLNTSALALESGGHLASIDTKVPALGQALAAASVPVVLTSAQLTTLTPLSTVTANQGGTWTVQPGNTPNTAPWLVNLSSGGNVVTISGAGALKVDGSAVTQPVSGTVTANAGSGNFTVVQSTAANLLCTASQGGTWNIGTVTTVSAVTAISNALPAGTNLLGSMAVGQQIANVFNGTTAITPSYATFSTSASGATQVVAAVVSKKIYVLRWRVSANGSTNVNLQSHTTTGQATGLAYLTQYASGGGAYCPAGIMATASGEALDVNNSAAIAISGEVTYVAF
jgi:hypothetical protein